MKRKLLVAICALTAMLGLGQDCRPDVPSLTKTQIKRVLDTISGNNTKTDQYCEIGKLNQRMAQADESDTETLEALGKRVDELARQIGLEFVNFLEA